jgi:hypothetical protein
MANIDEFNRTMRTISDAMNAAIQSSNHTNAAAAQQCRSTNMPLP